MGLTPEEIVSYDLKQSVRGYSVAQVDELLDRLADQVEAAQLEQERLEQRLREAQARLESTQETESTLKRTLVTAQQAAERSLHEAREEAEALLTRAREDAEQIAQDARSEAERVLADARAGAAREAEEARRRRAVLQERVDELAERERRYRRSLRELLERQLTDLDELEDIESVVEQRLTSDIDDSDMPAESSPEGSGGDRVTSEVEGHDGDPTAVERPDDEGGAAGLTVRVHGRHPGQYPGQESPLGSASLPGEE